MDVGVWVRGGCNGRAVLCLMTVRWGDRVKSRTCKVEGWLTAKDDHKAGIATQVHTPRARGAKESYYHSRLTTHHRYLQKVGLFQLV